MRSLMVLLFAFFSWAGALCVESAPLPPMQPVTVKGTIVSVFWSPAGQLKGIPQMSGSAGIDRMFPARYVVTLADVTIEGKEADKRAILKGADSAEIMLNHDRNDGFLKRGMRIVVFNYSQRGDEGGTWTSFDRIEIMGKP